MAIERRKRIVAAVVGLLVVAGALAWRWRDQEPRDVLLASGVIEATQVDVSFKIPGRVIERPVDEGDRLEAGMLVFRVPIRGSAVLFLGLSLIFLLGTLSLGMLISIRAKSQLVASQVAMVVSFLPSFLLSGFMYDIGNMPGWLQVITHAFPARYFVTILKGIFLKGIGLRMLGVEVGFLALFALIVTVAANRNFRKTLEG